MLTILLLLFIYNYLLYCSPNRVLEILIATASIAGLCSAVYLAQFCGVHNIQYLICHNIELPVIKVLSTSYEIRLFYNDNHTNLKKDFHGMRL